jgi:hypothetical protein
MSALIEARREWPALFAILGVFGLGCLLVGFRANVPVIDDWVYAWSVEHLLATGRLQVLEISAFYPVAQIVWGALFARVAGFSFVALRASTVILSALGCWTVYLTLRELGCRASTSLLGALALAFDPVYFALSFSFMTDVPFVSVSTMALYWYVRAVRRDDPKAVWAGCAFALAAFLIRPIGVLLPLAIVPALLASGDWRSALRRDGAPLAIALVVMAALQIEMPRMLGPLDWAAIRESYLRWWFSVPAMSYVRWTVEVLVVSAFPLTPLLLAYAVGWRRALVVGSATIVLALACRVIVGHLLTPLPNGQTWSLIDIAARTMLDGEIARSNWWPPFFPLLNVLGLLTVGALAVIGARGLLYSRAWHGAALVLVAWGVLQAACINVLWLYNDRYYLVLAPAIAIVAAQALDADGRGRWIASALLVGWAAVAISGTRDMLAFNDAAREAARELEATGIPAWDIDAGYSLNGWRLYAHPEHLPAGANRRFDVPFVTSNRATQFSIVNSPLPHSEVLRIVPLERSWWQATHAIYVVRRPVAAVSSRP